MVVQHPLRFRKSNILLYTGHKGVGNTGRNMSVGGGEGGFNGEENSTGRWGVDLRTKIGRSKYFRAGT